jgi:hypothetical protein
VWFLRNLAAGPADRAAAMTVPRWTIGACALGAATTVFLVTFAFSCAFGHGVGPGERAVTGALFAGVTIGLWTASFVGMLLGLAFVDVRAGARSVVAIMVIFFGGVVLMAGSPGLVSTLIEGPSLQAFHRFPTLFVKSIAPLQMFMWLGLLRIGVARKAREKRAIDAARCLADARGWPWYEPVAVESNAAGPRERVVVRSNATSGGANVVVELDAESGAVLHAAYLAS